MITVTLNRSDGHFIRKFSARGHAGYAPAGSDIICSAITAILTTAIGSLQDLAGLKVKKVLEDGNIECVLPDPAKLPEDKVGAAMIIMESMALGCRQIENSYGSNYVQVKESTFV